MNDLNKLYLEVSNIQTKINMLHKEVIDYEQMQQIKQLEDQLNDIQKQIQTIKYNEYYNQNEYKLYIFTNNTCDMNNRYDIEYQLKSLIGYIPYN